MSNVPADQSSLVLRVVPERAARASSGDGVAWWQTFATTPSYSVETCQDVYSALARIGRDTEHRLRAVLVCVDDLTPVEQEFFTLVPRVRRDLAIGVCGHRRSGIERSLALGAREVDGVDALDELLRLARIDGVDGVPNGNRSASASFEAAMEADPVVPATRPPSIDTVDCETEMPIVTDAERTNAGLAASVVLTESEADHSVEDDEILDERADDDSASTGSARVPWLSYDGDPKRAGPQRTPPETDSPQPSGDPVRRSPAPYEPLLTDEELRALIGDDLGSLGPERGERDTSSEKG